MVMHRAKPEDRPWSPLAKRVGSPSSAVNSHAVCHSAEGATASVTSGATTVHRPNSSAAFRSRQRWPFMRTKSRPTCTKRSGLTSRAGPRIAGQQGTPRAETDYMNIRALLACMLIAAAAPVWAQPFPIRNVSPVATVSPWRPPSTLRATPSSSGRTSPWRRRCTCRATSRPRIPGRRRSSSQGGIETASSSVSNRHRSSWECRSPPSGACSGLDAREHHDDEVLVASNTAGARPQS